MTSDRIKELRTFIIELRNYDEIGDHTNNSERAADGLTEALDALERVWLLLEKHYHTSGTDLISSTDVFLAASGEPPLYKRAVEKRWTSNAAAIERVRAVCEDVDRSDFFLGEGEDVGVASGQSSLARDILAALEGPKPKPCALSVAAEPSGQFPQ